MQIPIHIIAAFTSEPFKGNPAAVIQLSEWLPDSVMQAIATENNLSETVFLVKQAPHSYAIRWFSPIKEIDFCGHATLASAYVLSEQGKDKTPLHFQAQAVGTITATPSDDGLIEMRFPNRAPVPIEDIPPELSAGLSPPPKLVLRSVQAYFAIYDHEEEVRNVVPHLASLAKLDPYDVVVTAPSPQYDFVSRYFWPANGGAEDPVTGSIHAGLAPYWASRLNKTSTLTALQVSQRTGQLRCRVSGEHVYVSGACVQYLQGNINF
nr:PhzF family phenazine biosynthesis protein [uncultured Rhodoferax sp.]